MSYNNYRTKEKATHFGFDKSLGCVASFLKKCLTNAGGSAIIGGPRAGRFIIP